MLYKLFSVLPYIIQGLFFKSVQARAFSANKGGRYSSVVRKLDPESEKCMMYTQHA